MARLTFEKYKERIANEMLDTFEKQLNPQLFTAENELKRLEEAAELAEHYVFVTAPFIEEGLMSHGRDATFLHVFQPNIWGQDEAFRRGKLHTMTVATAYERGIATASVKIISPSVRNRLTKVGEKEATFIDCVINAALIESAYYTRLGNFPMPKRIADKIDAAIMKRVLRNSPLFRDVADEIGLDINDNVALHQANRAIGLTDSLQKACENDPYFVRREDHLSYFKSINASDSIRWDKKKIGEDFALLLLSRIAERRNVDPWLIKALENALKKNDFDYTTYTVRVKRKRPAGTRVRI